MSMKRLWQVPDKVPALQEAREVDKDTVGARRPVRLGRG